MAIPINEYGASISAGLSTFANYGNLADFGNTSKLYLRLPDGVTFTSSSGHFLENAEPILTSPIPEPSSVGLMLGGLAVFGAVARRKRLHRLERCLAANSAARCEPAVSSACCRSEPAMPTAFDRYDDLLHHVYDSALAPPRWPATLGAIAEAIEARSAVLWSFMHGAEQGGICFTHNLDQSMMQAWATISPAEDPFVQAAIARNLIVDGAAYKDSDVVPHDWLDKPSLYRDICVQLDIGYVGNGVVFAGTDGRQLPVAISLSRSPRDRSFEDDEIDLLRRLLPHLSRSLGVMFHLRDQAHQVAASRAALNRLGAGVVLLDGEGAVQFANAAAETLLSRSDMLRRAPWVAKRQKDAGHPDRLACVSRSPAVRAAFKRAIAAAIRPYVESDDGEHFAEALVLPDEHGKPAIVMHAAPLGLTPAFTGGAISARAIVFFHELNGHSAMVPEHLCQIFGMTPAEARAALQLLESGSMQDMADRLGVSLNTFKSQIKAAYAKTNTNRQAGLLRLMLSLARR